MICFKFLSLLRLKTRTIFIQNWFRTIFYWFIWYKTHFFRQIIRFPLLSDHRKFNFISPTTYKRSTGSIRNIPSTIRRISWLITPFLPLIIFVNFRHINLICTGSLRNIILLNYSTNNWFINLFNLIRSSKRLISTFANSKNGKKLHKHKKTHRNKWTC